MLESVDFDHSSTDEESPELSDDNGFHISKIPEERFNTLSHFFGGILALVGLLFLLIRSEKVFWRQFILILYSFSNALLFFASSVCHSQKLHEDHKTFWSLIDQSAIYIMIAGTYTPVVFFHLTDGLRIALLLGQWVFAVGGVVIKFAKPNTSRWVTASIYLFQGWMVVFGFKTIYLALSSQSFIFLLMGGLFYSIGAVFYITKKPTIYPGKFSAHELWHVFVLFGAASFYYVVYQSL